MKRVKNRARTTDNGQRTEKNKSWSVVCGPLSQKGFSVLRSPCLAGKRAFFVLLSAVLLIFAHPPYNLWFLAWIALVPLFFAIEGKTFWQSFRLGYLAGIVYFFGMFWWFIHVTLPGMILLNMFLALYFALFAGTYAVIPKKKLRVTVFLTACAWVLWEFVRARFLSGFGWATLGHTQYQQLWMIQIADITGVLGVSFILVIVNQFIYFIAGHWRQRKAYQKIFGLFSVSVLGILACVFLYGLGEILLVLVPPAKRPMRIAVIQPNIAQEDKWDPFKRQDIMRQLSILTAEAAKESPDVIVWPEASLPSLPEMTPAYLKHVEQLSRDLKVNIVLGYVREENGKYHNTAGFVDKNGVLDRQYDKLHLVPFGEFIPLRRQFPFLSRIVPIEDISPGSDPAVFVVKDERGDHRFSVLICFEDTVDDVARALVNAGAEVLVNITNDAWFQDTKAPWLHLQAAVFQAVGYKRPLVRSANTGVSAFVSSDGRINKIFTAYDGRQTFVPGFDIFEFRPQNEKTFLAMYGEVFAYLCIACLLGGVIIKKINTKFK